MFRIPAMSDLSPPYVTRSSSPVGHSATPTAMAPATQLSLLSQLKPGRAR